MNFHSEIYDISVILGDESIDYPGDTPFFLEHPSTFQEGGNYNLSRLTMSTHSGTHLDFPAHFIPGGKTAENYAIKEFIKPAQVIDIKDQHMIGPVELSEIDIRPGEALLFKTSNSRTGCCRNGRFSEGYVYLSPEAADYCVNRDVGLIGMDYATIEKYGDETFAAHRKILGSDIPILEGINLKGVPPGRYTLSCLPLNIKGVEAAPVRAVLLR